MKDTAEKGYAIDNQEIIPGGVCVAAPIFDRTGRIVAAISATVPIASRGEDLCEKLILKVKAQAASISMRLGKH